MILSEADYRDVKLAGGELAPYYNYEPPVE
jgi:hypothetical protein